MEARLQRTWKLIGSEALEKLAHSHVLLFGVGGVGSFTAEALVRAGIGHLTLVDDDVVDVTNINRQLPALQTTVGRLKAEVMQARLLNIAPEIEVQICTTRYTPEKADDFFNKPWDYVIDAIDDVPAKISLAVETYRRGLAFISSMGAGNKLDPTRFEVADIYETKVCPLARVMRKAMRERGVPRLQVVYSQEVPCKPLPLPDALPGTKQPPASISFVPSVAGLILASVVVRKLAGL